MALILQSKAEREAKAIDMTADTELPPTTTLVVAKL
jgi:hypothetical protein